MSLMRKSPVRFQSKQDNLKLNPTRARHENRVLAEARSPDLCACVGKHVEEAAAGREMPSQLSILSVQRAERSCAASSPPCQLPCELPSRRNTCVTRHTECESNR